MSDVFCNRCGDISLSHSCRCQPYLVAAEDELSDSFPFERSAEQIWAKRPASAAEKYAEQADAGGDYDIISGNWQPIIQVREPGGETHRFTIRAWTEAVYNATKAKPASE